jgi:hypothetical protein
VILEGGEIFAIDEAESTVYVLLRSGEQPVMADWPQHLLSLAPLARMMGTLGGSEVWHTSLNGQLCENPKLLELDFKHTLRVRASGSKLCFGRRSRITGSYIEIWDNRGGYWQGRPERWVLRCAEHDQESGGNAWVRTRNRMTISHTWCDYCYDETPQTGVSKTQVRDEDYCE